MELNIEIFEKLLSIIDDAKKNKDYEFEARFWSKNKILINEDTYNKVFQKLTFDKEFNGLGYKYEMKNILDVILDKNSVKNDVESIRMSIEGTDKIKKFWLNSQLEGLDPIFIEKEKIDKIDDENYNIRFSLKNELPRNNLSNKNINIIKNSLQEKVYRLKNRYSIITSDQLFSIDMSSVKTGIGKSFKESNTLKEKLNYEIEIEYIGKDLDYDNEIIIQKLLYHCEIILKVLYNTNKLLTNTFINNLKKNYNMLVKNKNVDDFIAASPVTIHRENLLQSDNIKNIFSRYAVTLKADGERHFLIVNKSDGKIFIFDNSFNFIDTGYIDTEWTNTLIEGELVDIDGKRELLIYDILFCKEEDVRRRYLIDIKKDGKLPTRIELIERFLRSSSRVICSTFSEENTITLKIKKYIQTVRNDGSDIFQKCKELWDSRSLNSFNVDGIIFTPKYEYYPNRGGSWNSLFKWKPPILNTIDFLIRVIKDDNKKDIKSPMTIVIDRPDGKQETIIKQYKSIYLYVSGTETVYNANFKSYKKKVPVLFNPYGQDEKNSEMYNLSKIFIEDDEKIYANDPLTNEKVEIYDDIIVEFGYSPNEQDGFKWIPYRFRKDKTMLYKNGKNVFGNSEPVARDIFKAINSPITEEMITTGQIPITNSSLNTDTKPYYVRNSENEKRERFPYQNFHNHYIKYQLLYFSSPVYIQKYTSGFYGKLLDLCCGRGVDINKIKRAKYAEIVGMDIDYENIKYAQEWYKNMVPSPKPKAYYVRGDSSKLIWPNQACGFTEADKIYTKKFIPSKYIFDTISLQFCFHYFFKDEISIRSMMQNLNDNLKIGGYVIGTTFDGERLYESLKNTDIISGKTFKGETMWKIEKKYSKTKLSFTNKKPNFGKEVEVFVKTIGTPHVEYLVNFNYVDTIMEEYGFSKVFVKPFSEFHREIMYKENIMDLSQKELEKDFDEATNMSEEEKRFSFLSSGFIYKKERNSSDSLMKKLVELMEKKDKKKGGIHKVDNDTEEIIEDISIV